MKIKFSPAVVAHLTERAAFLSQNEEVDGFKAYGRIASAGFTSDGEIVLRKAEFDTVERELRMLLATDSDNEDINADLVAFLKARNP